MKRTVSLIETLTIHPAVSVPTHCGVCAMWDIVREATHFGSWEDQQGPDNYIGLCETCRMSGFPYIGTIEEFENAQSRTDEAIDMGDDPIFTIVGEHVASHHIRTMTGISKSPMYYSALRQLIRDGFSIAEVIVSDEGTIEHYSPERIMDDIVHCVNVLNG